MITFTTLPTLPTLPTIPIAIGTYPHICTSTCPHIKKSINFVLSLIFQDISI